jgi:uncharacterized protein
MEFITYSLKGKHENEFYEQLSVFSTKIISEARQYFYHNIIAFKAYLYNTKNVNIIHDDGYLIEFITSGIYLRKYASYAVSSVSISTFLLYNLFLLRKKIPFTKPVVDFLRGKLSGWLLYSVNLRNYEISSEVFSKLVTWLKATGEFSEESKKLEFWKIYYRSLPPETAKDIIIKSMAFAEYFEEQGRQHLGRFTSNVKRFLEKEHKNYIKREDYLFCGRSEAEYHLNMFGAEILNRMLRTEFNNTTAKTVLLPTCMNCPDGSACKAKLNGLKLKCTSCSKNCGINKIQKSLKEKGIETCLIVHSSDFSDSLKLWKNQKTTGLVGVACVLNLLKGGYEMQNLNIPSQCVFLDHCGCKKHWHGKGIPTALNQIQLEKILSDAVSIDCKETGNKSLIPF